MCTTKDNTNQQMPELDEMRQQFTLLQKRLDSQVEIKDSQMRKALGKGLGQMYDRDRASAVVCFVGWLFVAVDLYFLEFPLVFQIFADVTMFLNFYASLVLKLKRTSNMDTQDLVKTSKELIRYKSRQQNYMRYVAVPYIAVFLTWFCYLRLEKFGATSMVDYLFVLLPMLVGACLGGLIGVTKFYKPSIRQADEMLAQIREIQSEQ